MTDLQQPQQESTAFERLAALKLLREYMFLANPEKYSYSDIAEDLPGAAKPIGHFLKNVLPTAAIVSDDPKERARQIQEAVDKIKTNRSAGAENVGTEAYNNAVAMAKASLIPGLALSAGPKLLGLRWIKGKKGFQSPFSFKLINRLLTGGKRQQRLPYAKFLTKNVAGDTASNLAWAAATGAIYPYFAHKSQVSDKSLEEARKIMEQQPYITSLPTSEMLSVLKQKKEEQSDDSSINSFKNVGMGAGLGALTGAAGGLTPTIAKGIWGLLTLGKGLPKGGLLKGLARDVKMNAGIGGAFGALSGLTTKNIIEDEAQRVEETKAEQAAKRNPLTSPIGNNNVQQTPVTYSV
jgi:hypothetical protein